jgi:predicted Zn-dependent peptidase
MVDERVVQLINETLGRVPAGKPADMLPQPAAVVSPRRHWIDMPDSQQTAIRVGRRLFPRLHVDYPGVHVLNTVLGGYFGSRLMSNIREEKGYTYNISSSIDPMMLDGYFCVATEVSNEYVEDTVAQIYHEMRRLREEPIGDEEMSMVRNYLLGALLSMIDGPFSVAEVIRTLVIDGVAESHFGHMAAIIKNITAEQVQAYAQQYLCEEDMCEVIVGPSKK